MFNCFLIMFLVLKWGFSLLTVTPSKKNGGVAQVFRDQYRNISKNWLNKMGILFLPRCESIHLERYGISFIVN